MDELRLGKRDKYRNALIARCNGLCELCGSQGSEMHEIVRRGVVGKKHGKQDVLWLPANTVWLCRDCHEKVQGQPWSLAEYICVHRNLSEIAEFVTAYRQTFKVDHEFVAALETFDKH